ncbi:MAG: Dihydrodipicolinate synthetase family protein [Planctomycetes bacterium ADurb.Bin126]|nr:MAG: Dihydrodipicolinate synthetase family protein [Planctomycetes bacterium ADurb.Bin126]HOD81337.1 dihydrodipicolinate synthase family protein [Phycisphaerae bacterium]HQL73804.1 dihydrodipicolinate synthase family protein [Phycisphaerae bacterium]
MAWRDRLRRGAVIPAHPLALTARRTLDERRQRALTRYYLAAGAGGMAIGVHTTQFEIRDPRHGLYEPVLQLAMEELRASDAVKIAGVVGPTPQAVREAEFAARCGYDAVLLGLGALRKASTDELLAHVRTVAGIIPVVGFYLQPSVGGRILPYAFWRGLAEIDNVVAVKIAPFNRYQTLDVVRAVADSGRDDLALYTGNDDNIVADLLTPYRFAGRTLRIVGGLLGHWAVWTRQAVRMLDRIHALIAAGGGVDEDWLSLNVEVTDANAAFFDAANNYRGCIAGIHEVLRRQGLLEGTWCLNGDETLSPGQAEEIDRVCRAYPHLADDEFVAAHRDQWLR